ncbi:hypothetical protein [Paenibacillus sp. y28]|uniref:hypothetical protein n=1 Tax=Paenibacillus sp. y28 TaxID=3129110 RepID=UPI0030171747
MHFKPCTSDEDFANFSLFFLENKHDLHPSLSVLDGVTLIYSYLTEGYLCQIADENGRVRGISAYYHGTRENEFLDKDVVYFDMAILDQSLRRSRVFMKSFSSMVFHIAETHPEVQELRLAALSDNAYLCGMYAKLTRSSYKREGAIGEETVFCVKINEICSMLKKYNRV